MPQVTLKVDAGRVMQGLRKIGDAIPRVGERRIKAALEGARDELRTYPAELPGQRYIRTGTYGHSITVYKRGTKSYTLASDAVSPRGVHYSRYVGGMADGTGQAQVHAGRWALLKDTVAKWAQTLVKEVEADLRDIIRGAFGGEAGGL